MTNEQLDPKLEDGIEPDDPSVSIDEQDEDEQPDLPEATDDPEPMTAGKEAEDAGG